MVAASTSLEPWGDIRVRGDDVRFGSKADIGTWITDVRFTPESGHFQRRLRCPLSAKSGHPVRGAAAIPSRLLMRGVVAEGLLVRSNVFISQDGAAVHCLPAQDRFPDKCITDL